MPSLFVDDDIPDRLKARVITEEVLGLARPQYTLRSICRVIPMDSGIGHIPIATALAGVEKVPQLVEAELSIESYTTLDFVLWKNVVHVAISKEATMRSKIDLWKIATEDAAKDLARMENSQISDAMDTITELAGTDWSADTTNDPLDDLMAAVGAIGTNGYMPTHVVMDFTTYGDLVSNDFVVNAFERGTLAETGRIPAIAGLNVIVDVNSAADTAYVVSKGAPTMVLATGPTWVEKYTGKAAFFDAYAIAKFVEPQLALDDSARRLTGV